MPKKKPSVHAAQDGVRSDLLKAIRDGKCIQTRCKKNALLPNIHLRGKNEESSFSMVFWELWNQIFHRRNGDYIFLHGEIQRYMVKSRVIAKPSG